MRSKRVISPVAVAAVAAVAAALLAPSLAHAQSADAAARATARQLGEEGMRAFDAGDCATAQEKLWRAHDLVHVPTLAYYAGKCLEKLGRLVDAEEKYLEAMRDPVDPNAPPPVKAAQVDAERAREALLPRIPSVLLTIRPPLPDALLTVDGKPVPPAMIGVKRPIDPGNHDAAVQRAGAVTHRPFVVAEGQSVSVEIPVPAAAYPYAYGYPPPQPGYAPYPTGYVPPPPMQPMQRRSMGLFVAGVILAPIGGLAIISGAALATSDTDRGVGTAIAVTGVVAMTGGIVMAVIGGKKVPVPPEGTVASVQPYVDRKTAGVRFRF